jgi:hypothetical protein
MLANKIALAIPAFVDLFTRHPQHLAFAITQIIGRNRESVQPNWSCCQSCGSKAKGRVHENYLRRDFAFSLAMTTNGVATVIRTSAKTMTKPNMICLASFGFSVELDKNGAPRGGWP